MSDITIPSSPGFSSATFRLVRAVAKSQSPFSFKQKRTEHSGKMWQAELELPPIYDKVNKGKWRRFLVESKGGINTFKIGDPTNSGIAGNASSDGQFDSFGANDRTLNTSGWNNNVTNLFREGDYISIQNELKMVMSDVDSDGSGEATINVRPKFRQSLNNGDSIEYEDPKGKFYLSEREVEWTSKDFKLGINFDIREFLQT